MFSLLTRINIVLSFTLSIDAEEPQGLTALAFIGVFTIVGSMPQSALLETFGGNSKSKELELE